MADTPIENDLKVPFWEYVKDIRLIMFFMAVGFYFFIDYVPVESLFSYITWKYIHILSAAMFSGLVVIMSILEFIAFYKKDLYIMEFLYNMVNLFDKSFSMLLGIGLVVGGISMTKFIMPSHLFFHDFFSIPSWVIMAFTFFLSLTMWWIFFDIPSQKKMLRLLKHQDLPDFDVRVNKLIRDRIVVNSVAIIGIPILYYFMIFRPVF